MSVPWTRRIVSRAVLVVAVPVVLLAAYIVSASCVIYAGHARKLPGMVENSTLTQLYVTPFTLYCESGLPGSDLCASTLRWSIETGRRARD
jgi:hypothetical protein